MRYRVGERVELRVGVQVGVDACRDGRRRVAELPGDGEERNAAGEGERGCGVSETVEGDDGIAVAGDQARALEDIIALRAERVLTSGGARSALEGAERIRERVVQANGRLLVMPGAGVTPGNIARIAALTGAHELHASAKRAHASGMTHRPVDTLDMADGEIRTDEAQVRALVEAWAAGPAP